MWRICSIPYVARRSQGLALLAVLWIVAALSIIAVGMTRTLRLESRSLVLAKQGVQAQALGEAAIQLALQALVANNSPITRSTHIEVKYRDVPMQVQILPLNGLIDINTAGLPLLQKMFMVAGGVPPEAAQTLAQAVVHARDYRDGSGRARRFEAEEDLLRVPGIDYDLYARLAGLLTADLRGTGRVNPLAAPLGVLSVLAGGDLVAAQRIATSRDAGQPGVDTSALDSNLLETSNIRRLRVTARVPLAEGAHALIAHSIDLQARSTDGAPWLTFRTATGIEPVKQNQP